MREPTQNERIMFFLESWLGETIYSCNKFLENKKNPMKNDWLRRFTFDEHYILTATVMSRRFAKSIVRSTSGELRKQIKHSLRQHGQMDESRDGIDLALCVFDLKNRVMQYSGANNPLYLIRDVNRAPELKEIKADQMPVGYYQGKDGSFTNYSMELEMGDTFYLFSDGFIDQKAPFLHSVF